jgi:hypothetical protein
MKITKFVKKEHVVKYGIPAMALYGVFCLFTTYWWVLLFLYVWWKLNKKK